MPLLCESMLLSQLALAIGLVLAGALQAAGDTKGTMYRRLLGCGYRVVGIYILGIYSHMGIAEIWIAIALDIHNTCDIPNLEI
ncbi:MULTISPECIES: hypothetical protein [Metabacillus]|uniref:Uncharacterized protein n=1 Tax=Metabacillus hrfriensis TaxID=3048891 RepID=A0ACD4RIA6_9BACI|nr:MULTISPECIES: hypothetical protein [Metabacillus]UAL54344.1 hypothetical protein K8L98_11450 [Metabacillus dongyingensis]USK30662.1 hypothetical protein LIT32_11350 [Bacillus sp. CMF21]WHZ59912.1 hypothetical protein QLQ22_11475 [Metabacillus sp. CT-WN-B3]